LGLAYGRTKALRGASVEVNRGEILAITGKSGSGKSSLLYCLAGVLRPHQGLLSYKQQDMMALDDDALSQLRKRDFGFVFQFGELVPELSLLENVALPLRLNGKRKKEAEAGADAILRRLQIQDIGARRPAEVSGGQAQRAAVARALVHEPSVVFADEPTGSLDSENSAVVLGEFLALARSLGSAVVLVTHDRAVAEFGDRHIEVSDGLVRESVIA
jgi:putative ABC transport system ATP-binding protein